MEMPNRSQICCFTGHRQIKSAELPLVQKILEECVRRAMDVGATTFVCGAAIGFDTMAGFTVLNLKERHPQVRLCLVIPCKNQDAGWNDQQRAAYEKLLAAADKTCVLSDAYYDGCMKARNQKMVDMSGMCIAFLRPSTPGSKARGSGTSQTVAMARAAHLPVMNVCDHPEWL